VCGIGGVIGDRAGVDGAALLAALGHRGPDQRAELAPAPDVWLAATRLAIRDPSAAGDQPMVGGDCALVYNGEVYNAGGLRAELEALGQCFRSRSDTEVVLRAYLAWGDDAVARLDGMFAFALWDGTRRRLLLARDPMGVKPLWIARGERRLAFASEVRPLVESRAAGRSIDPIAVSSFLAAGSVAEPRAIVRGVEAVPPGCALTVEADTLVARRARTFSLPRGGTRRPLPAESAAEVRARLEEAVAASLESDVPLALLLSGGVDSAAVAVLAARHQRGPLCAFHLSLSAGAAARARSLAASLGLPYREVPLAARPEALLDAAAAQDQPSVDGANTFLIARAIREAGFKAALTGLGADELFLGYPLHRSYLRARAVGALVPTPVAARVARFFGRAGAALSRRVPGLPWPVEKLVALGAARGGVATYAALRALFPPSSADRLQPDAPRRADAAPEENDALAVAADEPALSQVSRLDLRVYLVNTLLRDADVMSMAQGVELRVPLLDRRLVETVTALDPRLRLHGRVRKPLLVDAVPELSPAFRTAAKEGFVLPLERWLAGPLGVEVAGTLRDREAARRVGLDPTAIEHVWQRFRVRPSSGAAHRVWALFALLRWASAHGASA
jgi:asparagine synthase (glutamine-hydrolysing)